MIAEVTGWVKNIVLVVLFASFLELLLPASSMQRFVRVIMGLMVMIAILNPVLDIVHNKMAPENLPAVTQSGAVSGRVKENMAAVTEERDRLARELYKKDLASQIKAVVVAVDGVADARVGIELKEGTEGKQGGLDKVSIAVLPGSPSAGTVEKVVIGAPQTTSSGELSGTVSEKVKKAVKELYQLRESQIEIKKMN
jgi:stage III sporulation protein AF